MSKPDNRISVIALDTTPLGKIWLAYSGEGLAAVEVGGSLDELKKYIPPKYKISSVISHEGIHQAAVQIEEYLEGKRRAFDLPIDWSGTTDFQRMVLGAVDSIPYGETRSYGQIAAKIGKPKASRAVGRANATNPIPLVIPCHRVIGSDGHLRGYGAGEGIETKAWLLDLEKRTS